MSVFRVNKTKNYSIISNFHFKERGLSLKAKGLLSLMLSLPDDWNYSISGLVTLSKDGKDSVMSALAELEKFGYLKRTRLTNSKGQFSGVEYDIFEEPQPESPVAEEQDEDNQKEVSSNAEDRTQLITNSINNEFNKELKEQNTNGELYDIIRKNVAFEALLPYFDSYVDMRSDIGAPISPSGLEMLIQRCNRLAKYNINKQRVMLEAATINGWKNVYSPNDNEAPAAVRENDTYRKLYEFYGDDD